LGFFDGGPESIVLVLIIIILLFGSEKLPELARGFGRAKIEFEKGKRMFVDEMQGTFSLSLDSSPAIDESVDEESRIRRAAANLGIETEGKTEEELRKAIFTEMSSN
jgi:sec-independent protein translocase protein TatA